MNDKFSDILFWVNFVGIAIFIVNSIHATVVLRLSKSKEFKSPDMLMTTISVCMAVMFVALAISLNVNHTHPELSKPVIPQTEQYKQIGVQYEVKYDPIKKKNDTIEIEIYRKVK